MKRARLGGSMSSHTPAPRAVVALVTAASLFLSQVPLGLHAQAPAAAAPAAATGDNDGGWPRDYVTTSGAQIRIFQPQISSWENQKKMVAFAAASYTAAKAGTKPTLGTLKLEADTSVAVSERLVNFQNLKLAETNFPNMPKEQLQELTSHIVDKAVPHGELVLGLDRVLASIDKSQIIPKNVEGVKADPPTIYYSTTTAALVNIDGEPIWSPIQGNDLKFAVNTNWDLLQLADTFYLRYEQSWFTAKSITGPWTAVTKLPEAFSKLPADENWKEVKAAVPGRALSASTTPKIFVSLQPAEMILLQGPPNYLSVSGTKLLWVSNTESDIFRLGKTGALYYLVAGRWFSAPDFTGPWKFATTSLPDDFKKIPLSHERSRVLASVPGTDQANEAVLLAQIPETATVSKKLAAPEVEYQGGEPKFEPIEKTTVSRAVNTDKDIIKVGDLYYMCFQGVWFMGRSPNGPWEVTGSVPGEIYEIPVSSPSHAVTYVTVEDDDDDAVVFATAAMYTGVMVAWGCAVWGTGWYYPPYYYPGFYPYYRPYYPTYGFGASYNPWTGAYTRGAVAYGPYGGAGVASRYNPRTGTYSRGAAAWGPYGARGAASAYNPRTGTGATTRQGSSVYGSWGQTAVRRGDDWATTSRVTNNMTGATTRVTRGSEGGAAITRNGAGIGNNSGVVRTDSGDVYAGRDGNVYKKQGDGSWSQWDGGNGNWGGERPTPTQQQRDQAQQRAQDARGQASSRPADSPTTGQLNRDSAARSSGTQRTQDYGNYNRGGGASSRGAGSYRPSGGGMRAGGGRRR